MKCFYINLARETGRRAAIEENFATVKSEGWTLERFEALDKKFVKSSRIRGLINDEEKACFLSHKQILIENIESSDPIMILEDDAVFGSETCAIIDAILTTLNPESWDIIYSEIAVNSIGRMAELFMLKNTLLYNNEFGLRNLQDVPFFGASAYIMNHNSIEKIIRLMNSEKSLHVPLDLWLRGKIHEGKIKADVIFPFVTTISEGANISSIQSADRSASNAIYNLFRKMIWMNGDYRNHEAALNEISSRIGEDTKAFSILWAAIADKNFKPI